MSVRASIELAVATVQACPDEEVREAGLSVLGGDGVRAVFDLARTAPSPEFEAQLRVHVQFVGMLGADELITSLGDHRRNVCFLAFSSASGNIGLFFEIDATPIGFWVIQNT